MHFPKVNGPVAAVVDQNYLLFNWHRLQHGIKTAPNCTDIFGCRLQRFLCGLRWNNISGRCPYGGKERRGEPLQVICQYKPRTCISLEAQWYSGGRVEAVRTSFLRQRFSCEVAEGMLKDQSKNMEKICSKVNKANKNRIEKRVWNGHKVHQSIYR